MTRNIRHWLLVLVAVVLIAILWRQVFVMTGVLWWDAPRDRQVVARPPAPHVELPDMDWVDVDAYLRTHPVWRPPTP